MTRVVVDRIEGDWAVCEPAEGGDVIELPARWLPDGAGEGSVLTVTLGLESGGAGDLASRVAALGADDDGGDFSL